MSAIFVVGEKRINVEGEQIISMYDYVLLIRFEVGSLYSRYKFQSQSFNPYFKGEKGNNTGSYLDPEKGRALPTNNRHSKSRRDRKFTDREHPETPEDGPKYLSFSIENPCFLAKKVYTTIEVCVKLDMF